MDFKIYDRARRNASPLEIDLIESYATGKISRRFFVKRGMLLGLSVPFMGAIISACGSDDKTSSGSTPGTTGGSTAGTTAGTAAGTTAAAGGGVPGGIIRISSQSPSGPLDPPTMVDLASYGIVGQCFEYLCGFGENDIAPGLAEKWTPNADGSEWTFNLRKGVKWQDGTDFTADDVVATMERMVEAGNATLSGTIEAGSTVASDPNTVVITLTAPNGLFPYLVSVYNTQCAITPKAFAVGTTLDAQPNGTGPWKLTKYDAATGASFVRNDGYWGTKPLLDGAEWLFSDDLATRVNGIQGGAADAIVQFSVLGGDALLADSNFTVLDLETATHREIWMRCDEGQFVKKEIRQALALTLDRDLMVQQLFAGRAQVANDHPIAPFNSFYDDSVPQRVRDIEKAKQLLADAGSSNLTATLAAPQIQEIPDLAALVQSNAKEAGFDLSLNVESSDTFYTSWCATYPCAGGVEFGIVDYGHRVTPDVYLNAAFSTGGEWNSSQYSSPEFDAAFTEYKAALDVEGHKAACKKMETILNEDVPAAIPYFYNYLAGHTKEFTGVRVSALGQVFLENASKTA